MPRPEFDMSFFQREDGEYKKWVPDTLEMNMYKVSMRMVTGSPNLVMNRHTVPKHNSIGGGALAAVVAVVVVWVM